MSIEDIQARPRQVTPVGLDTVAGWAGAPAVAADVAVTGVCLDSRRIRPGDLYAALRGATAHGARFTAQAVAAGAVAVLTDADGAAAAAEAGVPAVVVPDPRAVLGRVSAGVYGDPAAALRTIGVTGTQGKTTVTRLLDNGLGAAGIRSAVVGTVGTRIAGVEVATVLTTPEAPDLHGLFAVMREHDVVACAMEVSSHALVLGRVDGVHFDVAVFLNLGRDHLDFHADVEDYYRAKASMFTPERARLALIDIDDEHGRRLAGEVRAAGALEVRTMSGRGDGDGEADWGVADVRPGPDGSTFTVLTPDGARIPAGVPLAGEFNVANALAAIAAAGEAGLDPAAVAAGIAAGPGVPGRLERVRTAEDPGFTVLVDYAHKPDAVAAVLHTLRPVTNGRLVIVLGAGGDRDTGKRPLMGEIAARTADLVIVTDDNPRSEDPAAIRAAILAGARRAATDSGAAVLEVAGRRAAIEAALAGAAPGDVIVVAGKGHETGQEVAGVVHPFDDRAVVAEVLAAHGPGSAGDTP